MATTFARSSIRLLMRQWYWVVGLTGLVALLPACSTAPTNTLATLTVLPIKIDKDARIDSARDKAMASYWEFMNSAPRDSLRVEALRRLADLELERSEDSLQKKLEKLSAENQVISRENEIELKGVSYTKAIKLYEDAVALAESTGKPIDPQLLYQLSKAYDQTGNREKSLQSLDRLLTYYPDIENRDEIYFRRGELLFAQKKYKLAEAAYTQVILVGPSSAYYEKAISKRGWTAYKMRDYDKAIHSFLNVVSRKFRDQGASLENLDKDLPRGDRELLHDTLRVVSLSFDELGGPAAIDKYFNNNDHRPYEYRIYLALAEMYADQGRVRDAISSYQQFAKRYPLSPKAPAFDLKAIDAAIQGGFSQLLIEQKIAFSKNYKVNGEYWEQQDDETQRQLVPILAKNVEDIATHFHSISQKTKAPEDYVRAQDWYKHYLVSFKYSTRAQKMNFLLAESLFENGQYELSAKEYEKTAYQYVKNGRDVEAGYAALVAYDKHAAKLSGKEKETWNRLATASALRFGKAFPEDPRAPTVLTKAAEDFFALKKYDQAAAASRAILELKSDTSKKMRLTAWLIIGKAEFERGAFDKSEAAYKIAKSLSDSKAQQKEIQEGLAAAVYKQGEKLRASGQHKRAAEQFNRVAILAPDSEINISAQFDLAAALMQGENWQGAVDAFLKFRREHPNHRLERKVASNLATAYLKLNEDLKAADEFEYLIHYEKDHDKKRAMAWQIAAIYEEAGRVDKQAEMYEYYLLHFPDPLEYAQEVRFKLASIYKQANKSKKYFDLLRKIVRADKHGNDEGNARSHYLAANAALVLAEPMLEMYREVELKAPLKQNLKIKKRFMKAAVDAYTDVANYGVSNVTTAAYYSLAQIYSDFSKELINSERPKGLSNDELEQYNILLEEQAYPFEEKSIDIHETNAGLAKNGTYDDWVRKSFSALKTLKPGRYAKRERSDLIAGIVQ